MGEEIETRVIERENIEQMTEEENSRDEMIKTKKSIIDGNIVRILRRMFVIGS